MLLHDVVRHGIRGVIDVFILPLLDSAFLTC